MEEYLFRNTIFQFQDVGSTSVKMEVYHRLFTRCMHILKINFPRQLGKRVYCPSMNC